MRIHQHFSVVGFCNTYVIGDDETKDALLIDPGHADIELIRLFEQHEYTIKAVLLTHRHSGHTEGLALLKKLYELTTYAYEDPHHPIIPNEILTIGPFEIFPYLVGGHSRDSVVYKIRDALFMGDALRAAGLGTTPTHRLAEHLRDELNRIFSSLDPQTLIFPGHGPPSTIQSELLFNQRLR
ncbi:MAG TPA: MBL fold metallo-hydrolase [Sphaerochaeta sp.]|jgi:glyoxylase-like metal-dependent hydrolase (beta-lactamase superfamily II)|nr:MBL fold metallo-hydrolase [Spirochaetales bacterium]HPX28884.1 MBL fold metallo-hydrolase [Sphaerochaeta sp.]HQB53991.1 MBL fold metallo-hydrolase [Sphaerochaeta sp.]